MIDHRHVHIGGSISEDEWQDDWQAIPCRLTHLGPVGLRGWPRKSRALTKTLGRRKGWMWILEPVKTYGAVMLELKRENKDEMSSLQDLLIVMGSAQYTDTKIVPAIPGIL